LAPAAHKHRHLGRRERQELRLVHQQRLGRYLELSLQVVAEAVGERLEHGEGLDVRLRLRGVHAARRERHLHGDAGLLRGLLDARAAREHDQVGERDLLAAFLAN
jgi:hypothetical protein